MPSRFDRFTEEELAAATEIYFKSKGWELFPEAVIPNFGGRADLIGSKQQLCMAVECKNTFSYTVLEQLTRWRHELIRETNSTYVDEGIKGIPHLLYCVAGGNGNISDLKREIVTSHRIGVILVTKEAGVTNYSNKEEGIFDDYGYAYLNGNRWRFQETIQPKIQHGSRRTAHNIIKHLNIDMRCGTAGSSGQKGGYMTPFKRTLNKAKAILSDGEEWHISDIIKEINKTPGGHHYSNDRSARGSISKFLVDFGIAEKANRNIPRFKLINKQPEDKKM